MQNLKINNFNWIELVLDNPELNHYSKSIALFMSTYMNNHQDMAWPSINTITKRLGISKSTVIRYTQELVTNGYLTVQQTKTDDNQFKNNIYKISLPTKALIKISEDIQKDIHRVVSPGHQGSISQTPGWSPTDTLVVSDRHPNKSLNKSYNKRDFTKNNKSKSKPTFSAEELLKNSFESGNAFHQQYHNKTVTDQDNQKS